MTMYKPGEGYDKGFNTRMLGGELPNQAVFSIDPYWKEYKTGWEDADLKIINEARQRNSCTSKKCCKKKNFIQD
jgi:hypothetical protein